MIGANPALALRAEPLRVSSVPASIGAREPTPDELRWARVHINGDRAKPLPEWWGKRR